MQGAGARAEAGAGTESGTEAGAAAGAGPEAEEVEEAVFGGYAASPAYGEWNRGKDTHEPVAGCAPYVQMAGLGKRAQERCKVPCHSFAELTSLLYIPLLRVYVLSVLT